MEEELRTLKELANEMAKKYDLYINIACFYGEGSNITYQSKEDEGTKEFKNIY